jgi:hypothetical protein
VAILVFALTMILALPSWAGTINFADCSTVTTTKPVTCAGGSSTVWTLTYSSGIIATGYHHDGSWSYSYLAIKNDGPGETGLGYWPIHPGIRRSR